MTSEAIGQEQEARIVRAAREAAEMTWTRSPLGWVVTTRAGKCYQVGNGYCSCPDWQYRGSKTGAVCKHQVSLGHMLLEKGLEW